MTTTSPRWIMWFAVLTHLLWGVLILCYGESVTWITAIHHTMALGFSETWLGIVYLVVGLSAAWGLWRPHGHAMIFWAIPQQFVLMYSALGAVEAMIASQFADGVIRPREFLVADQCPAIFLAVLHTCAMLEPAVLDLWKTWQESKKWNKHGTP